MVHDENLKISIHLGDAHLSIGQVGAWVQMISEILHALAMILPIFLQYQAELLNL